MNYLLESVSCFELCLLFLRRVQISLESVFSFEGCLLFLRQFDHGFASRALIVEVCLMYSL